MLQKMSNFNEVVKEKQKNIIQIGHNFLMIDTNY